MISSSKVAGIGRWLVLVAAMGGLLPAPGQAQLLKRLKDQVDKAVGEKPAEESRPAEATPQQRSPYNQYVLELTPAAAECFERALGAEDAALAEFRKYAATVKTSEQYQACQQQSMMGPEGQKLSAEYVAALEGKEGQAAMDAMQAFTKKFEAFVAQTCGPRPAELEERRTQALQDAAEKARAECGYTPQQYSILKERLAPICGTQTLGGAAGAVRVPGDGSNIFWVYSATEVEVLKQKCGSLQTLLKKLL